MQRIHARRNAHAQLHRGVRTQHVAGILERREAFGRPLYQEVEDVTGRRYAYATDQITARLPTREEAELLAIRPDTPVLHLLHDSLSSLALARTDRRRRSG